MRLHVDNSRIQSGRIHFGRYFSFVNDTRKKGFYIIDRIGEYHYYMTSGYNSGMTSNHGVATLKVDV